MSELDGAGDGVAGWTRFSRPHVVLIARDLTSAWKKGREISRHFEGEARVRPILRGVANTTSVHPGMAVQQKEKKNMRN